MRNKRPHCESFAWPRTPDGLSTARRAFLINRASGILAGFRGEPARVQDGAHLCDDASRDELRSCPYDCANASQFLREPLEPEVEKASDGATIQRGVHFRCCNLRWTRPSQPRRRWATGMFFAPRDYIDAWLEVTGIDDWPAPEILRLKRHFAAHDTARPSD